MCWRFLHFMTSAWEVNSVCNRTQTHFIKWCQERLMDLLSVNGVCEIVLFRGRTLQPYEKPAICGTQHRKSQNLSVTLLRLVFRGFSLCRLPKPFAAKGNKERGCSPTQNFVLVIQWKFLLELTVNYHWEPMSTFFNFRIIRVQI